MFNSDGSAADLDCKADAEFSVDFAAGKQVSMTGKALSAGDKTPISATYSPVCDSDRWVLYQTWTASKSGTLDSVSLNIARGVQTVPLTITVFKFASYNDLIQPE
jgi:hypothetical protein